MSAPTDRFDASALEKDVHTPPGDLTGNTTLARNSVADPTESLKAEDSKRYLNEEQALNWCRKYPESKEPIYITYSQDDKVLPLSLTCQALRATRRQERQEQTDTKSRNTDTSTFRITQGTGAKAGNGTSPV